MDHVDVSDKKHTEPFYQAQEIPNWAIDRKRVEIDYNTFFSSEGDSMLERELRSGMSIKPTPIELIGVTAPAVSIGWQQGTPNNYRCQYWVDIKCGSWDNLSSVLEKIKFFAQEKKGLEANYEGGRYILRQSTN